MTPVDHIALTWLRALGAQRHFVPSPHGPLHALDLAGSGELGTIVLLHGLSARCSHFAPLVRHLRRHFSRLVMPDLLGHGFSAVPSEPIQSGQLQEALEILVDALVEEPRALYGNSLGGYCAIQLAAASPERYTALVVNSPAGARIQQTTISEYRSRFQVKSHADAMAFLEQYFGEPIPMRPLVARGVLRQLRSPFVQSYIEQITDADCLEAEHFARLKMPTLLLWGQRDGIMIPEQLAYFRQHLPPSARLEEPEHYGHAPYIEHPADLAGRILGFVRETRPQG
ncbi:MAG: pimeloyl-ACP methyl ester carboxylesterase [Myxococcota bacterium]|jgi:pimeloyl-ACP methyl ester carboxylesterase